MTSHLTRPPFDLIIRDATLVTPRSVIQADLAVRDGVIVEIGRGITGGAREEIDASGLHVLPGVIDLHVHFNDPGRSHWEGWRTGSAASAVGGTTTVAEMPLNASPPTLTGATFDAKVAAAENASHIDFALWGGLTPVNLEAMAELAVRGVVGFKAFMSNSGINDFPAADDATLRAGMSRAAELGLPVAVHAEDDALTTRLAEAARRSGQTNYRAYLDSRPVEAELAAISRALELATETGCELYVVHVSSAAGIRLIADAKARGVRVRGETCPHYLLFSDGDLSRFGAPLKCAPPVRSTGEREELRRTVHDGLVDTLASDHSPSPPDMKESDDFFQVWGGIAGCQSLLPAALSSDAFTRDDAGLKRIAAMLSHTPAWLLRQSQKGDIQVGFDADLVLVDVDQEFTLEASDLHYRHPVSPYVGFPFRGRPLRTILRGNTVAQDGRVVGPPRGRLITPARDSG
jgi:allantoinase